jgi:hypothetical protein
MHGYSATWRVCRVDAGTWEPCGELQGIEAITVERDGSDEAPMLESATVTATMPATERFEPGWHRVYMDAVQGQYSESVPIATFWLDSARENWSKGVRKDELSGSSVLMQAAAAKVGNGSYALNGVDGADLAARMLAACIDAPVSVTGGFELTRNVVFDLGASVLEAAWTVLREGGWIIWINGHGDVEVKPLPDEPALVLDREGAAIMMPRVISNDDSISYTREWHPGVHPYSVVRGALPEYGLDGIYRVSTQRLTCGCGIVVEESIEAM